jgi:Na+/H+ antiporter NhaA
VAARPIPRTAWARNLAAPVRDFLNTESAGAAALLIAALAALMWANAPWSDSYESVWTTELSIRLGSAEVSHELREWINDGLMTFYFLVVGLEAKRELDLGSLRERRRIVIAAASAAGGMAVAVALYLALNAGGDGADGWGAAMSTDTAFALGVLGVIAGGATRLRLRLLTITVIDDLIALVVIATAYTESVEMVPLLVAAGLFAGLFLLRFAPPTWRLRVAAVVGVAIWVALLESGIDPVIAGLAVGLITGAYPPARSDLERVTEQARSFREQPTPELARSAQLAVAAAISPNDRLQHRLHPWTSFVIVPLFALANAGIHVDGSLLSDAVTSPITLGIVLGYVVGKPLGVTIGAWIAYRAFGRRVRLSLSWPLIWGAGTVAGIGFTVALLIANIAFAGRELELAKVGILSSAVLSALVAFVAFRLIARIPDRVRARQLSGTAEDLVDLAEDVDEERDHIRGSHDAPVTLIEYGDYECPYCGQAEVMIRELLDSFGDDLRYVWRHLPLNDVHTHAQLAAEAAEAAAAQGRFWDFHDMLLTHQDNLTPAGLARLADELDLDLNRFWADIREHQHADRIADDVTSADASGVAGTPSFFINGKRHDGAYDIETLTRTVRAARARAQPAATVA